ncbi:MAG: hypothetical protein ABL907_00675 [Hyphomicrobium sp.]
MAAKLHKMKRQVPPTETPQRLPRLITFLGLHMALGMAAGVAFSALVLMANVSGLRDLIANSSEPYLVLALLYAMNALTFSSAAMGIAVMTLPSGPPADMRDPEDRDV